MKKAVNKGLPDIRVLQIRGQGQREFPCCVELFQRTKELTAKHLCYSRFRDKETLVPGFHEFAAGGYATARDACVDVGMKIELLSPGVQYAENTRCCPHKLGVSAQGQQRFLNAAEQECQQQGWVGDNKLVQLVGECENHVVISDAFNKLAITGHFPLLRQRSLAARA